MKKPLPIAICLFIALNAASAFGQSADEIAGDTAARAGRLTEALRLYSEALRKLPEGSSEQQRIREAIFQTAVKAKPPIPEEARRYMARGRAAIEMAKNPEDFRSAASEFHEALRTAPWLATAYYNLGLAQEKAGDFEAAIANYKLYLLAAPNAPDGQQVRSTIYGLEYKAERGRKEVVAKRQEQERKTQEATSIAALEGKWCEEGSRPDCGWNVKINGKTIEFWHYWDESRRHWLRFRGEAAERKIVGSSWIEGPSGRDSTPPNYQDCEVSFTTEATISADARRIELEYVVSYNGPYEYRACRAHPTSNEPKWRTRRIVLTKG